LGIDPAFENDARNARDRVPQEERETPVEAKSSVSRVLAFPGAGIFLLRTT
jgi:hypothetical protein